MQADLKGPSESERDKHSCCLGIFREQNSFHIDIQGDS